MQHDNSKPVGRMQTVTSNKSGLYGSFKVSASTRGSDAILLAQEKLMDGLSVGVEVEDSRQEKDYLLVLDFVGNAKKWELNFEILDSFIGSNTREKILEFSKKKRENERELVFVANGCSVRLSISKIELFGKTHSQSKEDFEKCYDELRKEHGSAVSLPHMRKKGFTDRSCLQLLGISWREFKISKGDKFKPEGSRTPEECVYFYKILKKKLGRLPIVEDLSKFKDCPSQFQYFKHFGTWKKFKKYVGDDVSHNKDSIIKKVLDFKENNGRYPTAG